MMMEFSTDPAVDNPGLETGVLIAQGYPRRHDNKEEAMALRRIVLTELAV
jgi:hypothetical protein